MVGFTEVERIALRKQWVVTKCDLSRHALGESVHRLKTVAIWVPSTLTIVRTSGRLLFLAAPLARYLAKRRPASTHPWSRWWQWGRSLLLGLGLAGGGGKPR